MTPISVHRHKPQAGFTLLELLVVLAIIIVATALIIPNISTIDNSIFNAQIRKAVAVLNHARRVAIVQGTPAEVGFFALEPARADVEEQRALLALKPADSTWISEDIALRFQSDVNQRAETVESVSVTFYPQGGSTGGVLDFNQQQLSAKIRIDPITGRIATAFNGEDFGDAH